MPRVSEGVRGCTMTVNSGRTCVLPRLKSKKRTKPKLVFDVTYFLWQTSHGVAASCYCEQRSHKYRKTIFDSMFRLRMNDPR